MPDVALQLARRFDVSRESLDGLRRYVSLLQDWQARINLIAPASESEIWTRHIGDSLTLLPFVATERPWLADLGSGAGFPGLALAIVSGRPVHLVESNGKKAAFLSEAARITGARVVVHRRRIEAMDWNLLPEIPGTVTARALAPLDTLLGYTQPLIARGAIGLFPKGRHVESELKDASKSWRIGYEILNKPGDSEGVVLKVWEAYRV